MKGNCETCRFWEHLDWPEKWGGCDMTDSKYGDAVKSETLAHAWTDGIIAGLATHATFGCVQWEGKA